MTITIAGFYLLFRKQIVENRTRYLLSAFFLAVFLSGFMLFYSSTRTSVLENGDVDAIFQVAITVFGAIFTVSLFDDLNGKRRALWLALPVSAADRIVCLTLFSLILFPFIFCLMFALGLTVTSDLYPLLDAKTLTRQFGEYYSIHIVFLPKYIVCQTCIAVCSVYYRRYVYLKAILTVSVLFGLFTSYYHEVRARIIDLPAISADVAQVDIQDVPEKWAPDKTREVWVTDIARDENGKKTTQRVKERVAGSVGGTLYGFLLISLATNESAIMPVARYFHPTLDGELSQSVHKAFSAAFYIALVLGWIVVWLRLKESQL